MADTLVSAKKPKPKTSHPRTSEMVTSAIKELQERSGSSLHAIKKYIAAEYEADSEKLAPFIRKYLKSAVESGALIQTKGKGASGSFKLVSSASKVAHNGGSARTISATSSATSGISKKAFSASQPSSGVAVISPSKSVPRAATKDKKSAAAKKKPAANRTSLAAKAKVSAKSQAEKPFKAETKLLKPKKTTAATPKAKSVTRK